MRTITAALMLLLVSTVLLAACSDDEADSTEDAEAAPTSVTLATQEQGGGTNDLVAAGREVYLNVGCAQCHGDDAEGSMMAPALAGHTPEQVRRQVRNPVGMMPRFDEDDLSERDLESLAAYIDSLEGDHGHGFEKGAPQSTHLLMMLIALKSNDLDETHHHLSHAREFIDDPEVQQQLDDLEDMLDAENIHDAEHMIENMLEGAEADETTMPILHLEVAVQALRSDDPDDARHHLEHALDGGVSARVAETISDAIDAIDAGNLHDAEDLINSALGEPEHDED